jgi:hypothetical protein
VCVCVCVRAYSLCVRSCAFARARDPDWELLEAQAFVPAYSIDMPYDTASNSAQKVKGCACVCACLEWDIDRRMYEAG